MKLIEALERANAVQEGPPFHVLLASGFQPLHLETAVKAHLRMHLANRTIVIWTGVYGDLPGTLECAVRTDVVLVALAWGALDPRLACRSAGKVNADVVGDARTRLRRIDRAIAALAVEMPVALSLP